MPTRQPIKIQNNAFGTTVAAKELIKEINGDIHLYSKCHRFFNNYLYHLQSLQKVRKPTRDQCGRLLILEAKTKILTNDTLPLRIRQLLTNVLVAQTRIKFNA